MASKGEIRIGISGWTYAPWRGGPFYPKGLPHREELAYASRHFRSIEINGTFYRMQRPSSFSTWRQSTPGDFIFAIKGPRYITHMLKLRRVETPLANFLASGPLALGPKLGPILWQFPPRMAFDADLLENFLALLPHDTQSAAVLAQKHDERLHDRSFTATDENRPLRHALEIRHDSFRSETFIDLLRRHKVGLVCADTVEWPLLMDVTADFIYCRLHGSKELYVSGYDEEALDRWAARIAAWSAGREPDNAERVTPPLPVVRKGRDVYVYFDNDVKVRAPRDARALAERLGVAAVTDDAALAKAAQRLPSHRSG